MILDKIEEKANETLRNFGIKTTPVPIEEIVSKLGIKISRGPSKDFSGILIRKDDTALIGVNSSEAAVRQRFTIAHELGHYYLHPKKDTFIDYRHNKKEVEHSPNEREADMFAAALLMPREEIEKDFRTLVKTGFTDYEVEKLAEHYRVSEMAMKLRILNLNLRS